MSSPERHWFESVADVLGAAYLRYSFTRGTAQEVDALVEALALKPGARVLDVGCGPGRHAHELGRRGIAVHGVDISSTFLDVARTDAPPAVTFELADARALTFDAEFDAAISLCQGAFGLGGPVGPERALEPDLAVLRGMCAALRPGGRAAVTAFNAYFQVRHLEDTDTFDAATGVNHEHTELRDEHGAVHPAELWTTCMTPRELRLLASAAGLVVDACWGVTPGDYRKRPPDLVHPEFLLLTHRPG